MRGYLVTLKRIQNLVTMLVTCINMLYIRVVTQICNMVTRKPQKKLEGFFLSYVIQRYLSIFYIFIVTVVTFIYKYLNINKL
jgi:hypothetical protein